MSAAPRNMKFAGTTPPLQSYVCLGGKYPPVLSPEYILNAKLTCFRLLAHAARRAASRARDNAGNNSAARIAMIAITTNNSINVKPRCFISIATPMLARRTAGHARWRCQQTSSVHALDWMARNRTVDGD
jgi:hypothetical protein